MALTLSVSPLNLRQGVLLECQCTQVLHLATVAATWQPSALEPHSLDAHLALTWPVGIDHHHALPLAEGKVPVCDWHCLTAPKEHC